MLFGILVLKARVLKKEMCVRMNWMNAKEDTEPTSFRQEINGKPRNIDNTMFAETLQEAFYRVCWGAA